MESQVSLSGRDPRGEVDHSEAPARRRAELEQARAIAHAGGFTKSTVQGNLIRAIGSPRPPASSIELPQR